MRKISSFKLVFIFIFRFEFRCAFRYLLYLIGYQELLPGFLIKKIKIKNINSPLISVSPSEKLSVATKIPYLRKQVFEKLVLASSFLPHGYTMRLLFAYRDTETQKQLWDDLLSMYKSEFPGYSEARLIVMVKKYIAEPTGLGPHQTGAAVDVDLLDSSGTPLNMGTKYLEFNTKTKMFSRELSFSEKKNRKILRSVMMRAGFCFYPGEWWHYSFGDRMWAAYLGKTNALYGEVVF